MAERLAAGGEQDAPRPHAELGVEGLERRHEHVHAQHHAASATVWGVVHAAVTPKAMLARALELEGNEAFSHGLPYERSLKETLENLRKKRNDGDTLRACHGVTSSMAPALRITRGTSASTTSMKRSMRGTSTLVAASPSPMVTVMTSVDG